MVTRYSKYEYKKTMSSCKSNTHFLGPHTLKANGLIFADSETFLFNMLGSTLGNMVAGLVSNLGNIFGLSFTEAYDPSIDAAVSNEISTAAFRMGHSLLQGVVRQVQMRPINTKFSIL